MRKSTRFPILLWLITALMCPAVAYSNGNPSEHGGAVVQNDTAFVSFAADAGMLEVYCGKLALANSTSAGIKKFGPKHGNRSW